MSLKIETVTDMPDFPLRGGSGKWAELMKAAEDMKVGQIIKVTLPNKQSVQAASATLQSGGTRLNGTPKNPLKSKGYRFATHSQPANGNRNGEWCLFIKRIA